KALPTVAEREANVEDEVLRAVPRQADAVRSSAHGVESMDEGIAAVVAIERVSPTPVGGRSAGDRIALHHPAALSAVCDCAGQQPARGKVVGANDVTRQIDGRHVLDQVQLARVRRERVEGKVSVEKDGLCYAPTL